VATDRIAWCASKFWLFSYSAYSAKFLSWITHPMFASVSKY
jgi:hypothetical protein